MEIKHKNTGIFGEFYSEANDKKIGEMVYRTDEEGRMVILHTEVFDKEVGKGLGKELVKAGVEFARANNQKIIPLCPYAKLMIERNKEYHDVLSQ